MNSAFRAIWLVPLSRDIKYYSLLSISNQMEPRMEGERVGQHCTTSSSFSLRALSLSMISFETWLASILVDEKQMSINACVLLKNPEKHCFELKDWQTLCCLLHCCSLPFPWVFSQQAVQHGNSHSVCPVWPLSGLACVFCVIKINPPYHIDSIKCCPRISAALENRNINKCCPQFRTAPTVWCSAYSNNSLKKLLVVQYSRSRKPRE